MKRSLTLAFLVLLAVSCGGRRGHGADGDQVDSLATETPEAPSSEAGPKSQKTAKADTISLANFKNKLPQEPIFDIVTSMGTIRVKLYKDTPKHRDNFVRLALTRYYDGLLFHRVIDGFMIQGGDPYTRDTSRVDEWGEGGPGYTIDAELVPEHTHKKGALAAARRVGSIANPMKESSGSQFYLVQDSTNCKHLNGEYTVFGETIGGLNVIDRIARVQTDRLDRPVRPVVIQRIRPNEQMNKRAREEEKRALEEAANPTEPEAAKKENTNPEEEILLDVQTELKDTSILGGRKLKHRGSKKSK
jgi:cyclophilin family peptidyl-prolyl cis-trans isomerase